MTMTEEPAVEPQPAANAGDFAFPLVEQLTKATEQAVRPLLLSTPPTETLLVGMMDERHFLLRVLTTRELGEGDTPTDFDFHTTRGVTLRKDFGLLSFDARAFLHRIPERDDLSRSKNPTHRRWAEWWACGATDITAVVIHCSWPKERVYFTSESAELTYRYLVARFFQQNSRALMQARFKKNGEVPEIPDFIDHEDPDRRLSPYQKAALAFCLGQEGSALFMEQGTGKTPVAVATICTEARRHRAGRMPDGQKRMMRALVICPNEVRSNWVAEFQKFATVSGKVIAVRGDKLKRLRTIQYAIRQEDQHAFGCAVIGIDTFKNDVNEWVQLIPWDRVIIDESHTFKSVYGTQRGKAVMELRNKADRRTALTGTPMANTILDYFPQLEWLGQGQCGFVSVKAFTRWFAEIDATAVMRGDGKNIVRKAINVPLMQERLARLAFTITKQEAALDLPDKVFDQREVEMTPKQAKIYEEMAEALVVRIKEELELAASGQQERWVTANNILTQTLRLGQITAGHVRLDDVVSPTGQVIDKAKVVQIDPGKNPKIQALIQMLEDPDRDPLMKTIVWTVYVPDIHAAIDMFNARGIPHETYYGADTEAQREHAVRRFNSDPNCRVFLANPAVGGQGLNLLGYDYWEPVEKQQLTYAGHVVWLSKDFSLLKRLQAIDRAHRRGTRMPVRVTDIICPGTIDEVIMNRVVEKEGRALDVKDISAILEALLGRETTDSMNLGVLS